MTFRSNKITPQHHPWCGYWWKGYTPPSPPLPPPPAIGSWQQAVDPSSTGFDTFGFLTVDSSPYIVSVNASSGLLTDVLTYTAIPQTIDGIAITSDDGETPSVRHEGTVYALMELVWGAIWDSLLVGVDHGGAASWHIVGSNETEGGTYGYRSGSSFEISSTGDMLVVFSNYDALYANQSVCYIKSTDYGLTWGAQTAIETVSTALFYYDPPVLSKGLDGNLYVIVRRSFAAGFKLQVFVSTDFGSTWDTHQVAVIATFVGYYSVAANSTTVYAVLGDTDYAGSSYVSIDAGVSWTPHAIATFKPVGLAASDTCIIVFGYYGLNKTALYRSTDGIAFAMVYDLWANGFTSGFFDYASLRFNEGIFAFTYCNMGTPGYLQYLRSIDDGLTWSLITTNILTI